MNAHIRENNLQMVCVSRMKIQKLIRFETHWSYKLIQTAYFNFMLNLYRLWGVCVYFANFCFSLVSFSVEPHTVHMNRLEWNRNITLKFKMETPYLILSKSNIEFRQQNSLRLFIVFFTLTPKIKLQRILIFPMLNLMRQLRETDTRCQSVHCPIQIDFFCALFYEYIGYSNHFNPVCLRLRMRNFKISD